MAGAQDDLIFAELGNLGREFEIPCSPAEREKNSPEERERACMKWRFSVYSLLARRCIENLRRDAQMSQAIVSTAGLQNLTTTTVGGPSVQERAPVPLHISNSPMDVDGWSEVRVLPACTAKSGDMHTEDEYVRNQSDHDLEVRMETLLKMDRESGQWTAATIGILEEMKKHTEKSPILEDLQKQRGKLGKATNTMQEVSEKLERDVKKNSNALHGLLDRMTTFVKQTYGMPCSSGRIHERPVALFDFISGIIEEFERLLKRLHDDTFKSIRKIQTAYKELRKGELSPFKLFQSYGNTIGSLVQDLLGKQESNFISFTTIKKWYRDVDQADACTRVLVPPDGLAGEQMVITPKDPPSRYASPSDRQ